MVGFSTRNQHVIQDKFKCKICSLLLREPAQLSCAHRQCKSCIESKIENGIIICPECREATNETEIFLDRGFKNDMNTLTIECCFCGWTNHFKDYEAHLLNDHKNPSCDFCDQQFNSISELELHKINDCERVTARCPLETFGCSSLIVRKKIHEHYLTMDHQNSLIAFILRDTAKIKTEPYEGTSGMDIDTHSHATSAASFNSHNEDISQTVDVLNGGLQILNDDVQRLENEAQHIQSVIEVLSKDVASLKVSVTEQNTFLDTLKPTQDNLSQEIITLKSKTEEIAIVSNEGIHIWKLTNFAEKMAEALSERQPSIYSPPFFSSPTGYKMRVRLYLNGDGSARKTHMSLFFVLMRSDYDAILKYPFNFKVTFCLYDQSGAQNHIIDSFRPDIKSNSFQRPRSEMNIASGIPKFVALTTIQGSASSYIRDDTMFIKIMVEFIDLPKPLLVYALSLNPAYPMSVQQALIKQEEKKVLPVSSPTTS